MIRILYTLLQWSWGLPQTLAGFLLFFRQIRQPHRMYHGAVVTEWAFRGSASLGMFLFLGKQDADNAALLRHEYGHSLQSLALGPLYLLTVGIPSFLWFWLPVCRKLRRTRRISYYAFYTERWADKWGSMIKE